jgi:hypothetical protein
MERQYNGQKEERQYNGQKEERQYNGQKEERQYNGQKGTKGQTDLKILHRKIRSSNMNLTTNRG